MKVLVTGALGFVGGRTCARLEEAGHAVIRAGHSKNAGGGRADHLIDIVDGETFSTLNEVGQIDAVVHCAGIAHRFGRTTKEDYSRINVEGTRNVAEFAAQKGIGRFVHLSSVLIYGQSASAVPVTESYPPQPVDDYSLSKLGGELAVTDVCSASGMSLAILRPVPIIGEGSRGNVARLIRAIDQKRFIWIGDGRNRRSFVHVDDVANAVLAGLSIPGDLNYLNVTGGTMTVKKLVEFISEDLGKRPPAKMLPHEIANMALSAFKQLAAFSKLRTYHRTLETWLSEAVYSGEAFIDNGFRPEVNLREAVRREVDCYLSSKG
ncbi:MAG: NAD-dependent epimerase/dehydratase family protein [Pyrinomonadaceae bacterium]